MKTVAIIAEFNPFHNGHKYIIEKAKEITGADNVLIIMSGNFVQRGEPAIINKYIRTRAALSSGSNMVIELPVRYATASAEYFAMGAIKILNSLNVIDYLVFGAESDNISEFQEIASILANEPDDYKAVLKESLKEGLSYPKAREKALTSINPKYLEVLSQPNNILAIEYLKALITFRSDIKPILIKRTEDNYNSQVLSNSFSSATAIRKAITDNNLDSINGQVPDFVYEDLKSNYLETYPVLSDDFSLILGAGILKLETKSDLENRIDKLANEYKSFAAFADKLKTKNETLSNINRKLLSITLSTNEDDKEFCKKNIKEYAKVLGFNNSSKLLKEIKTKSDIPVITVNSDGLSMLEGEMLRMYEHSIYCDDLYKQVCINKFKDSITDENEFNTQLNNKLVIIK